MNRYIYILLFLITLVLLFATCNSTDPEEENTEPVVDVSPLTVFDAVLYYDGYATTVDLPVPEGVVRIQNSRYAKKIPTSFINSLNNKLTMNIKVKAACDNYDRIGSVFLSLITKGEAYDQSKIVTQIELARFITPFMDKNKSPEEVPYAFEIDNVAKLLMDTEYSNKYDFWLELDIFGVPYAANKQIAGCAGRNDTFFGTLTLVPGEKLGTKNNQSLLPISNFVRLNNYNLTDEIGKTVISFTKDITAPIKNAKIYLITSNHGSNSGGEEYSRRNHYVYFDSRLVDVYIPGGKSCEPYRTYNTQSNGIYGTRTRTEAEWSSFSNWCPGDIIPIRVYELGNLEKGQHTFKFEVPDAEFVEKQGEIPLSAYIQGDL